MAYSQVMLNDNFYQTSPDGQGHSSLQQILQHCNVAFTMRGKKTEDIVSDLQERVSSSGTGLDVHFIDYFTVDKVLLCLRDIDDQFTGSKGLSPYGEMIFRDMNRGKNNYFNKERSMRSQGPVNVFVENVFPSGLVRDSSFFIRENGWLNCDVINQGHSAKRDDMLILPSNKIMNMHVVEKNPQTSAPVTLFLVIAPFDECLCGDIGRYRMFKTKC